MFILKEGRITVEAKALFIPEFKRLWSRDKTKKKLKALSELAFVYFMADYKSEFNIYGVEKEQIIAREVMGKEDYEPDGLVLDAIKKYEDLQQTYSMRYLRTIRSTVDSLMKYYDDLRYKAGISDTMSYNPDTVIKSMKDVEAIVEKLEKWEKKVYGEEEAMKIKGGGTIGLFEDKEKATWLQN